MKGNAGFFRRLAERTLARGNLRLLRHSRRHIDVTDDIARLPLNRPVSVIFDVGANIGQSARRFRAAFPAARIEAFEPIPATYADLKQAVASDRVGTHPMALGSTQRDQEVIIQNESLLNSLVHNRQQCDPERSVAVRVERLDKVAQTLEIDAIDLLKVDTEGYELEVFHGAGALLDEHRIALIYCEAGFYSLNTDFHDIFETLTSKGYLLHGFYEQATAGKARLDHFNCLFVSPQHVDLPTKLSENFMQRYAFPDAVSLADRKMCRDEVVTSS